MRGSKKDIWAQLILITQLGLSLITPLLGCVFAALWIQRRWNMGYGVVIVGIILGLGGMASCFYGVYRRYAEKGEKQEKHQFNEHR